MHLHIGGERDGYWHELIAKDGLLCLVRRSKDGQAHFEVIRLQWSKGRSWPFGRITLDGWHYPSSQQWGIHAWTCNDLAGARRKYDELCSETAREASSVSPKGGVRAFGRVATAGGDQ
ncbi:MAG TPA: hypothetical protein VN939_14040 [Chthoniobacterales bacterium]|nr:hypothetical protein [Chthoniobacterales bacterium]